MDPLYSLFTTCRCGHHHQMGPLHQLGLRIFFSTFTFISFTVYLRKCLDHSVQGFDSKELCIFPGKSLLVFLP